MTTRINILKKNVIKKNIYVLNIIFITTIVPSFSSYRQPLESITLPQFIKNFNKFEEKETSKKIIPNSLFECSYEKNNKYNNDSNLFINNFIHTPERLNNFGIKIVNNFVDTIPLENFANEFILFSFRFTTELMNLVKKPKREGIYKLKNIITSEIQKVIHFKNFVNESNYENDYDNLPEILEISIEFLEFINDYLQLLQSVNLKSINNQAGDEAEYRSKADEKKVKIFLKNNLTILAIFDFMKSFVNENYEQINELSLDENIAKRIKDVTAPQNLKKICKRLYPKILIYLNYFSMSKSIRKTIFEIYENLEKSFITFVENEEIYIPNELQ